MDELRNIVFLSYLHCTGEHGKSARWLRDRRDVMARSVCMGLPNYLHYPNDYGYSVAPARAKELVSRADAVILEEALPKEYGLTDADLEGKIVVRDAHGTFTRMHANKLSAWSVAGNPEIYRTHDLSIHCGPKAFFSPCSIDFNLHPYRCSVPMDSNAKAVIAHAPTNRSVKGTAILMAALEQLPKDSYEFILSEGEPNSISLFRRRAANIYFDQIANASYYGYKGVLGVAGIEAAAMGQVVLGDFDETPPTPASCSTLEDVPALVNELKQLVRDGELRSMLQLEWHRWAIANRDRDKVGGEFYRWLCRQSPYSHA